MIVFIILAALSGAFAAQDGGGHRSAWVGLAVFFALIAVVYNPTRGET